MKISVLTTKESLGKSAASFGASLIRKALEEKGRAHIILATGNSQFEMLAALVKEDIDWSAIICFHLDEYIGLSPTHPASFRKYLKERVADIVSPQAFHFIDGEAEPGGECLRLGELIAQHPIDVAFVGIGENGHLAFNDPPADFHTNEAFIDVELDEACRLQQLGEGWFEKLQDVPSRAISMSVNQIMKSKNIICSVPDSRKATATQGVIEGPVTPDVPASILQLHESAHIFLDLQSSELLNADNKIHEK